jgi:hypothetical protein
MNIKTVYSLHRNSALFRAPDRALLQIGATTVVFPRGLWTDLKNRKGCICKK